MQLLVDQEDDEPLVLYEVADQDVPKHVRQALEEFKEIHEEDLTLFTRDGHVHQ